MSKLGYQVERKEHPEGGWYWLIKIVNSIGQVVHKENMTSAPGNFRKEARYEDAANRAKSYIRRNNG